jgi:nicotinate-nucleotide--dimethylbenzimidazole phosphoribosyltransferase
VLDQTLAPIRPLDRAAMSAALAHPGLTPLVDPGLRLGEGTGAGRALPIVASAVRVRHEVGTFDSAGVSAK